VTLDDERKRVHAIMRTLDLPEGQYALAGSAAMVLSGIQRAKEMGDLDIFVSTRLWFQILDEPGIDWQIFTTDPDDFHRRCDPPYLYATIFGLEVNIFSGWRTRGRGDIDVNLWVHNAKPIEGLMCVPLEFLLDWKRSVGRSKDIDDIKLLMAHLGDEA